MMKHFLKDYLSFTLKERTGIIVILVLILFFSVVPFLFPYLFPQKKEDSSAFEKELATLRYRKADSGFAYPGNNAGESRYRPYAATNEKDRYGRQPVGQLFYFDPNTLSADGWKRLGIRDKTITTILKYISKGGKFRKPDDIGKIWGLHEDEVQRLMPYVSIKQEAAPVYNEKKETFSKPAGKAVYASTPVDINTADTTAFIALPGIGSRLANRIVNFRDKLGGFYKVDQVAETYALPDSTFAKIKSRLVLSGTPVKQININTATLDELKAHPYIRYNLANAIVQYRAQHGQYAAVTELKKIMMVTEELYNKVMPYLTVQ
jgi:competence protein ComEA